MSQAESRILAHPSMTPTTADEWAARMHGPDVSERDRAEFHAWLRADPANADAYAECEVLWVITHQMRSQPVLLRESRSALAQASLASPARRRHTAQWALAASAAVVAIAVATLAPTFSHDGVETATRKGEQRIIALQDGSTIQLNTDTIVSYRLNERERRVDLHRGEAFFDVIKDPSRPFIVKAGRSEVQVVGTQFTVRQDANHLEVIVKEGKVNVLPDAGALTTSPPQHVELTTGASLRLDAEQQRIKVTMVDADRAMAWRTGNLDFDAATLEHVVAELNRYAERPFVIEDDAIRDVPVTGRVRASDLESIRYMLRESFYIESVARGNRIALRAIKR